jgi:UDP-N-acetylglucosamine acyltransferase
MSIDSSNFIDSSAVLVGEVRMGSKNYISKNVVLIGPLLLGDKNFISPGVVIGAPPQDDFVKFEEHVELIEGRSPRQITIGNGNILREFVTIHKPQILETKIGDNNYIMAYAHVSHDTTVENCVKISNSVQMGGFSYIMNHSYLGLNSTIRQFIVIGPYSMVGMGSIITRHVNPGAKVMGNPAQTTGSNRIGLERVFASSEWWSTDGLTSNNVPSRFRNESARFLQVTETVESLKLEVYGKRYADDK